MSSRIIDVQDDDTVSVNVADEIQNDMAQVNTAVEQELNEAQVQTAVEELPEKLRGKSAQELAEMYTNLEKHTGKQANEIGELRKITDEILLRHLNNPPVQEAKESQEPEATPDFFDDPERAVKSVIERELAPLRQEKEKSKQQEFQTNLQNSFPDYEQIVGSPDFADWVQTSPYRLKMYQDADNWNWDAANELLSTYKALKGKQEPAQQEENKQVSEQDKAERAAKLKAASVEKGSTGETTRKVYRRADLGRLLENDPERYYALEPEIRKAYAEGRVR